MTGQSNNNNKIEVLPLAVADPDSCIYYDGSSDYISNCDNFQILTKPNIYSLYMINISTFESNIMKMNSSNNSYGLSANTDVHMIKNSEWGAVAYLSHSKYGTCTSGSCTEIGINNNSSMKTGCGSKSGSSSSSSCNEYNTELGKLSSTTENIYGVYGMSGGANEYVMGNVVSNDGTTMTTNESGFTIYPEDKYYDKYSYSGSLDLRIKSKLGDGIKEVYNTNNHGWYNNNSGVISNNYAWFVRGGAYNDKNLSLIHI